MTIIGTRPEIIRLAPTLEKLDQETDHILVHTGQNYDYELNEIFFRDLGLRKPDYFLECVGDNLGSTLGNIIAQTYNVLNHLKPDCLLILGDTNSCLSAISAKRLKIPIFHIEAGNRCYDIRVPEEINRKIVDHTSDLNLTYSERARENLLREGLSADRVLKIGSPIKEIYNKYRNAICASEVLQKLELEEKNYFVISFHREENVSSREIQIKFIELIEKLHTKYRKKIIVSLHPRAKNVLDDKLQELERFATLLRPLSYSDYIKLQKHSYCTLSDSGTITEESMIIGFPAVNLRFNQERHEGMDEGGIIMTGVDYDRVDQAINILEMQGAMSNNFIGKIPDDYDVNDFSSKVVRLIHSYTHVINRYTWFLTDD